MKFRSSCSDAGLIRAPHGTGVWVLDLAEQTIVRAGARGRRAFAFAINKDLYVPEVRSGRSVAAEMWFGKSEGVLAKLLGLIDRREFAVGIDLDELMRVVFGVAALGYRSGYEISLIEEAILSSPDLRERLGISIDGRRSAHRVAVENCINMIGARTRRFLPFPAVQVVTHLADDLIICDRPVINLEAENEIFLPLGPRSLVRLRRGMLDEIGVSIITPSTSSPEFVASANKLLVQNARRWIVGTSENRLKEIRSSLDHRTIALRRSDDLQSMRFIRRDLPDSLWWAF